MHEKKKTVEKGDRLWFRITMSVLPMLTKAYFKLVDATSKKVILNRECEDEVCLKRAFAMAGFHGSAIWPAFYSRKFGGVIMVSRSFDGDLMDRCLRGWGYWTVRGSSSRGGKEALTEIIDFAKEKNCPVGMAVDAPRGPAGKAKIGVVVLARETGQPVVPVGCFSTRHVTFNSWDKMILPLPFSTIVLAYGKPVDVPEGLDRDDYEQIRIEIEQQIALAQNSAEAKVKDLKNRQARHTAAEAPTCTTSP
jgi:lysophospholipid acyltransferase (LPLAT)-like uncharacterized protein